MNSAVNLTIYFQLLENLGGFIDLRTLKISPNEISTSKWGDLLIMKLKNGQAFVLANTSSCGIGPKKEDVIKLDGKFMGRLMARTVLIKVLSSGAQPMVLVVNLCVEFFPTGSQIFQGIREEAYRNPKNETNVIQKNKGYLFIFVLKNLME